MSTCTACVTAPTVIPTPPVPPKKRGGGPRTTLGKEQSRRNALKDGLYSKIVFPEDFTELIEKRTCTLVAQFAPQTDYETGLVRDMALASARIEHVASLAIADLIRVANRAESCWEFDRRKAVEDFSARLSKDPQRVSWGLRATVQGADWLIESWEDLGDIVRKSGRWDEEKRNLACDLMGIRRELRTSTLRVPACDDAPALIALVENQLASLRASQESVLEALNEAERGMTLAGMPLEEDAATARLRKAETRARNELARTRNELLRVQAGERPKSDPKDRPASTDRPPLSNAAIDNLVERSKLAPFSLVATVEEKLNKPAEVPAAVSPAPAPRRLTRTARREIARRAREQAKREAKAARTR